MCHMTSKKHIRQFDEEYIINQHSGVLCFSFFNNSFNIIVVASPGIRIHRLPYFLSVSEKGRLENNILTTTIQY